jgi:hypothetical protein
MIFEHDSKHRKTLSLVAGILLIGGIVYYAHHYQQKDINSSPQEVEFGELPGTLSEKYISAQSWPPQVRFEAGNERLNCSETPPESSLPQRTALRKINGRDYCVRALSEGAAGSVYTQYSYSTVINGGTVTLDFTLRFPQCLNYDDPQKTACSNERETFDLDGLVDGMVRHLNFS